MSEHKWALVTDGEAFEALATTLIFFEDPDAALFGRRGKDGGQDARSGDGKGVYQAKHHVDATAANAIRDALAEANKIALYRAPGHRRARQWRGVSVWRLVTDAVFNPTDREKWDEQVVPRFKALGLAAHYWERADLDALLDKHPEVSRAFFGGEPRVFLSPPEARKRVAADEPFLRGQPPLEFVGRRADLEEINSFLASDKAFLLLHGAGGVGKTRLMLQAAEAVAAQGKVQVLWANVETMAQASAWFDAIVPSRSTLLLVDEPRDDKLLRVLAEQVSGGRLGAWKVLVAVRSAKDPVLGFLAAPGMKDKVAELALEPPSKADAVLLSRALLSRALPKASDQWLSDAAAELPRRFSRHPIWLGLAVELLVKHSDIARLPREAKALAQTYLE